MELSDDKIAGVTPARQVLSACMLCSLILITASIGGLETAIELANDICTVLSRTECADNDKIRQLSSPFHGIYI